MRRVLTQFKRKNTAIQNRNKLMRQTCHIFDRVRSKIVNSTGVHFESATEVIKLIYLSKNRTLEINSDSKLVTFARFCEH